MSADLSAFKFCLVRLSSDLVSCNAGDSIKGKLWMYGNMQTTPGLLGFTRSARKEPKGEHLRCVFSADDAPASDLIEECRRLDLYINMFSGGRNGSHRAVLVEVRCNLRRGAVLSSSVFTCSVKCRYY